MILGDRSAWKALYDEAEIEGDQHTRAQQWFSTNPDELITTNDISDETTTMFLVKADYALAVDVGNRPWPGG